MLEATLGVRSAIDGLPEPRAVDLDGSTRDLSNVRMRGRLRRDEPAARPDGRGRGLRPAEGRDPDQVAAARRRTSLACADVLEPATGRRRARDVPAPARPVGSVSGCSRSRTGSRSFALRPGVDLVMEATDFDARLGRRRPRHHRRGPDRRPDRVRQDRARRRAAGAGGRRRRASPSAAASRPDGSRRWRRSARSRSRSSERPMTVEAAMAAGAAPLERCGERLARLVALATRP